VGPIAIRDARPEDVDVLRAVFRRSSLSNEADRAHLLANPDALEWGVEAVVEGRTRVAVVDDRVVGFATTTAVADGIELDDLFVDPDWMRRGVGHALLMDVVATARARGILRINVSAGEAALGFYARAGFVAEGVVETRFGPAPRMHLDLKPA
jgi:GNAT superfamily N-acetyltransferase